MHYRSLVHLQVVAAIVVIGLVVWIAEGLVEGPSGSPVEALSGVAWAYALPLALATLVMMFQRAKSAEAILGYRAAQAAPSLGAAILQNTLEQTVLGFLALVAFASRVPSEFAYILPVAAWLFLVGRLLFAAGYAISPMWRFFGFSLNFYGGVLLLLGALYFDFGTW